MDNRVDYLKISELGQFYVKEKNFEVLSDRVIS